MLNFDFEYESIGQGLVPVVGVDEAGRGPWAGPVVAGAVILDIETIPQRLRLDLDDSKKLTSKKREELFQLLLNCAKIGIGVSSVNEIDTLNILQATMLAMKRAVEDLGLSPGMVLVDGNLLPNWSYPCPLQLLLLPPRSAAIRSWLTWRKTIHSMDGSEMLVMAPKDTKRAWSNLASASIIDEVSNPLEIFWVSRY